MFPLQSCARQHYHTGHLQPNLIRLPYFLAASHVTKNTTKHTPDSCNLQEPGVCLVDFLIFVSAKSQKRPELRSQAKGVRNYAILISSALLTTLTILTILSGRGRGASAATQISKLL